MLIISYDIESNKLRRRFSKMLEENGAIRLQYSVYEVANTQRLIDNIKVKIETYYSKQFSGGDSIFIFEAPNDHIIKYGNAIHRDTDIVYF